MSGLDRVTEHAARWMASRASRRTFLAGVGKVAMATAGGAALATVFDTQAQARVCGQSGVSPKCPTYDCQTPGFWGWCWYASPGCCTNGGLKKICDCCLTGWPNVQGYCPGGAAVYCVVESCLEDPRAMRLPIERWKAEHPAEVSLLRLASRPSGSTATIVVAEADDPLVGAIALPVAAELGAPLLLIRTDDARPAVLDELRRLGVSRIVVVGPRFADTVLGPLGTVGIVEVLHRASDVASVSVEVASWLLARTNRSDVVVIGAEPQSIALAGPAAAVAAHRVAPVLVGPDAAGAVAEIAGRTLRPLLIGATVNGLTGKSPSALSLDLAAEVLSRDGGNGLTISFAPVGAPTQALGVAPVGGIVVLHDESTVGDELRDWVSARRSRFARAELLMSGPSALTNDGVYALQSALNGFDAHLLTGRGGDGLPVWPQLPDERSIGKARVSGPPPPSSTPAATPRRRVPEDLVPVPTVVMPPPALPSTTSTRPGAAKK